jgi:uncharacterized membrane protein YedE/YeeE
MNTRFSAIGRIVTGLAAGLIFGLGLSISGMLDPARVRGFLDVAGKFDPSLGFVLAGAVLVSGLGYLASRRVSRPLFDGKFHVPARHDIDWRLILGSVIFGIGWGMAGLCPGPAIASLSLGIAPTFLFTATMLLGIILYDRFAQPSSSLAAKKLKEPVDSQV